MQERFIEFDAILCPLQVLLEGMEEPAYVMDWTDLSTEKLVGLKKMHQEWMEKDIEYQNTQSKLLLSLGELYLKCPIVPVTLDQEWQAIGLVWENGFKSQKRIKNQSIQDILAKFETHHQQLLSQVEHYIQEIQNIWDDLDLPKENRQSLIHSIDQLETLKTLAHELRQQWVVCMKERVDKKILELKSYYNQCHFKANALQTFLDSFPDIYSPVTLDSLGKELIRVQELFEETKTLIKWIQDRNVLLQRMKDFEITARDPKRLFRPSFQLLEEEKFRKNSLPNLLRLEAKIFGQLKAFHHKHGIPFEFEGMDYHEVLVTWLDLGE